MDAEDLVERLILKIEDKVLSINGASTAAFFGAIVNDVMTRTKLTEAERTEFEDHAELFIHNFGEIIRINDETLREAALQVILSALCMSAYHADGSMMWQRLKAEIEKERVKQANLGRSRPDIKKIIARRARSSIQSLWLDATRQQKLYVATSLRTLASYQKFQNTGRLKTQIARLKQT